MNCVFLTQGASLRLFHGLGRELAKGGEQGFVVADSWAYRAWLKQQPEFESQGYTILKEWEVTADRNRACRPADMHSTCERLGAPGLFQAVIADRRLIFGPRSTYSQDYRRRFDDRELFSILDAGVEAVENLFDRVQPDVVIGFICATFLEYLADVVARARGIPSLNLRTARIGNQVTAATTLNDPSPELSKAYARICAGGSLRLSEARAHISRVRGGEGRYEGVILPSAKPARAITSVRSPLSRIARFAQALPAYYLGGYSADNHTPGLVGPLLHQFVRNPLRARRVESLLAPNYVTLERLRGQRFAFLPLHTEPEVSQLVYSFPLVNQIELVRMIAFSLPADMVLVVKEHPWMVGKRSLGAYRKLLAIPRVRFVSPSCAARVFVEAADLITVLTSSVALEAAMLGKPVLSFGRAPFNLLPDHMVCRASDLMLLPETINELLSSTSISEDADESALEAYVAAVLETSVPANLYSVLLGRAGVHTFGEQEFSADIGRIAGLVHQRLAEGVEAGPAAAAS